jgi:predicted nucleic-acid-binding Zn-ribbon protein
MEQAKSCGKCGAAMAAGFILDEGGYGMMEIGRWQEGAPSKSVWTGIKTSKAQQRPIQTWRCSACGFLESYAA